MKESEGLGKAVLISSDFDRGRYWRKRPLRESRYDEMRQLIVYRDCAEQMFRGFGGAFTEAAGWAWLTLSEKRQAELLEAYFGESGLRYALGRVHLNSCDFSLSNYACVESREEYEAGRFSVERDSVYLLPFIQAAGRTAGRPIELLLSPWSPPAFMKDNGDMNRGGKLLPEYRVLWAECLARYALEYRRAGCCVRMLSVQNEPAASQKWDSCLYTGEEEGRFAAEFLRPALDKAGLSDVGLLLWDHNKERLFFRARESMAAAGDGSAVAGFAFHWYAGDHFSALPLVRRAWPEKELWFTEGCVEYSRCRRESGADRARRYAHDIIGNLANGANASIDWNLLLDEKGGPNHAGNYCEAPVMLDGGSLRRNPSYYAIGHFSRYIRPGAVRLCHSVYDSRLECVAFRNPDGSRAAVVLNRSGGKKAVWLTEDGERGAGFSIAPGALVTLCWGLPEAETTSCKEDVP